MSGSLRKNHPPAGFWASGVFGGEEGDPEEGVEVLLDQRMERFLQGHRGNREFGDLIGGEFEEFEVGHGAYFFDENDRGQESERDPTFAGYGIER